MEMFDENNKYVSLANKYRPQTFEDMVGQENISKTLKNALKLGRIAHAYLFYGPRGCGKTTTARILAKALNCTGTPNPRMNPAANAPNVWKLPKAVIWTYWSWTPPVIRRWKKCAKPLLIRWRWLLLGTVLRCLFWTKSTCFPPVLSMRS